jgi:ornithine--oxo-acid transaminase
VPPPGYLAEVARICRARNVLLLCDEIQSGLGRTGRLLACQHEGVVPDGVMLGKALGGGLLPVSLFLARRELMQVFTPGDHGSTFGGNPIAAAVGLAALDTLIDERLVERAAVVGAHLLDRLASIRNPIVREVRGRGLFAGVEIDREVACAGSVVRRLLQAGVLTKDTHRNTIRFAPPLVIDEQQIDWAVDRLAEVLEQTAASPAEA